MAGKNQVVLTFAGDSDQLEKSFSKIGASSKKMGDDVGHGTKKLDALGEKADLSEMRILGMKDSVDGVATIMKGPGEQGIAAYLQGWADLASGIANFGVQFAKQIAAFVKGTALMVAEQAKAVIKVVAGWVVMGAQALVNAAKMAAAWLISLGPIGLVIAAIGAVIGILVALGVNFDDIKRIAAKAWELILGAAKAAFNWLKSNWPLVLAIITGPIGLAVLAIVKHWDKIKAGFTAVKNWIGDRVNDIVGFFTGLPARISKAAKGMWNGLTSGLVTVANFVLSKIEAMLNGIVRLYKNTVGRLPGAPDIDTFSLPRLGAALPGEVSRVSRPVKKLAAGGIVTRPTLALVGEAGPEAVVPLGSGMGGTINVYVQGSILSERDLKKLIRDEFARGGFR